MYKVILTVTLRAVRGGVITGILLAVARMSGETAPLLFTALNNQFWQPRHERADGQPAGRHLPVRAEPVRRLEGSRVGGAFLITLTVLVINILARTVFRQSTVR